VKRLELPDRKRCAQCGLVKHVEDFALDRAKRSGRKSLCRVCDRVKARRYYAANREAVLAPLSEHRVSRLWPELAGKPWRAVTREALEQRPLYAGVALVDVQPDHPGLRLPPRRD
jgi:hypothetical protein